ncbi:MAG: hypothetical protein HQL29_01235 [Candidatus Omnitrophica bacterium]|nr:hypothetical protein [Candidatus Omnitrophota bacterium]
MKKILKTISIITVVAFISTNCFDLAYSSDIVKEYSPLSVKQSIDINSFELPSHLGEIRSSWSPSQSDPEKGKAPVIYIQDAHCNYDCQKTISEIIDHIETNYGIDTINLEGGAEDYDTSIFTNISDREKREKVADYFVKQGLINGAEYYAINNPEKVDLWGVENVDLYIKNLKVYRNLQKNQNERDKYLEELDRTLKQLKAHIFNPGLLEISIKQASYKNGTLDFKEYVVYLAERAGVIMTNSLASTCPNITKLTSIIKKEETIDFRRADAERSYLIEKFQKTLSKRAKEDLVKQTINFKNGTLSQEEYYKYLVNTAENFEVDLTPYPQLAKYIEYINTYDSVNKLAVFDEITELETSIKEVLFENNEQRELDELSNDLVMLKNLFNISITRDDWDKYNSKNSSAEGISSFDISSFTSFIKKESSKYNIIETLSPGIESLDNWRSEIEKFYKYSFDRDNAFISNLSFTRHPERSEGSQKPTILITGGFHSENLFDLFKQNNIPYVSISPTFTACKEGENPYFDILSGRDRTTIKDALPSVLLSTLATPAEMSTKLNNAVVRAMGDTVMNHSGALIDETAKKEKENGRRAIDTIIRACAALIPLVTLCFSYFSFPFAHTAIECTVIIIVGNWTLVCFTYLYNSSAYRNKKINTWAYWLASVLSALIVAIQLFIFSNQHFASEKNRYYYSNMFSGSSASEYIREALENENINKRIHLKMSDNIGYIGEYDSSGNILTIREDNEDIGQAFVHETTHWRFDAMSEDQKIAFEGIATPEKQQNIVSAIRSSGIDKDYIEKNLDRLVRQACEEAAANSAQKFSKKIDLITKMNLRPTAAKDIFSSYIVNFRDYGIHVDVPARTVGEKGPNASIYLDSEVLPSDEMIKWINNNNFFEKINVPFAETNLTDFIKGIKTQPSSRDTGGAPKQQLEAADGSFGTLKTILPVEDQRYGVYAGGVLVGSSAENRLKWVRETTHLGMKLLEGNDLVDVGFRENGAVGLIKRKIFGAGIKTDTIYIIDEPSAFFGTEVVPYETKGAFNIEDIENGKSYIFVSKDLSTAERDFAVQHETFEIAWRKLLRGMQGKKENKYIQEFGIDRSAHILAWASQIIMNDWKSIKDCEFLTKEISLLAKDHKLLEKFIEMNDDRSAHRNIVSSFLAEHMNRIFGFEESVQAEINFFQSVPDKVISLAERIKQDETDVYLSEDDRKVIEYAMANPPLMEQLMEKLILIAQRNNISLNYFVDMSFKNMEDVINLQRKSTRMGDYISSVLRVNAIFLEKIFSKEENYLSLGNDQISKLVFVMGFLVYPEGSTLDDFVYERLSRIIHEKIEKYPKGLKVDADLVCGLMNATSNMRSYYSSCGYVGKTLINKIIDIDPDFIIDDKEGAIKIRDQVLKIKNDSAKNYNAYKENIYTLIGRLASKDKDVFNVFFECFFNLHEIKAGEIFLDVAMKVNPRCREFLRNQIYSMDKGRPVVFNINKYDQIQETVLNLAKNKKITLELKELLIFALSPQFQQRRWDVVVGLVPDAEVSVFFEAVASNVLSEKIDKDPIDNIGYSEKIGMLATCLSRKSFDMPQGYYEKLKNLISELEKLWKERYGNVQSISNFPEYIRKIGNYILLSDIGIEKADILRYSRQYDVLNNDALEEIISIVEFLEKTAVERNGTEIWEKNKTRILETLIAALKDKKYAQGVKDNIFIALDLMGFENLLGFIRNGESVNPARFKSFFDVEHGLFAGSLQTALKALNEKEIEKFKQNIILPAQNENPMGVYKLRQIIFALGIIDIKKDGSWKKILMEARIDDPATENYRRELFEDGKYLMDQESFERCVRLNKQISFSSRLEYILDNYFPDKVTDENKKRLFDVLKKWEIVNPDERNKMQVGDVLSSEEIVHNRHIESFSEFLDVFDIEDLTLFLDFESNDLDRERLYLNDVDMSREDTSLFKYIKEFAETMTPEDRERFRKNILTAVSKKFNALGAENRYAKFTDSLEKIKNADYLSENVNHPIFKGKKYIDDPESFFMADQLCALYPNRIGWEKIYNTINSARTDNMVDDVWKQKSDLLFAEVYKRIPLDTSVERLGYINDGIKSAIDFLGINILPYITYSKDVEGKEPCSLEEMLVNKDHTPIFNAVKEFSEGFSNKEISKLIGVILELPNISPDNEGYTSYHKFNRIINEVNSMKSKNESTWKEVFINADIKSAAYKKLLNDILGDNQYLQSFKSFQRLNMLIGLSKNRRIFEVLEGYREKSVESKTEEEREDYKKIYDYYIALANHPAMNRFEIFRMMIHEPEKFLELNDIHTNDKIHNVKKPSALLEFKYIDIDENSPNIRDKARKIIEGLILGKYDDMQVIKASDRQMSKLEIAVSKDTVIKNLKGIKLLGHILKEGYLTEENIKDILLRFFKDKKSEINNANVPEHLVNIINLLEGDRSGTNSVSIERLLNRLEKSRFGVMDLLERMDACNTTTPSYNLRIIPKSDPLAMLTGSEGGNCMAYGSGKNNVYIFNPNTAFFALSENVYDAEKDSYFERIIATSVVTANREVPVKVNELVMMVNDAATRGTIEDINMDEVFGVDFIDSISSEVFLALDNIEAAPNAKTKFLDNSKRIDMETIVEFAYKTFFEEYIRSVPYTNRLGTEKGRKINKNILVAGIDYSDFLKEKLRKTLNNKIPQVLLSYSDNLKPESMVIDLESEEEGEEESELFNGVKPLSFEDTLEVSYIENRAFRDKKGLKSHLAGIEMQLMALAMNEALQGDKRKNLSLGYFKDGKLQGYIVAYIGKEQGDDPVIYIEDFASLREGVGGYLLAKLFKQIKKVIDEYSMKYGKELVVRCEATTGETGSFRMLSEKAKDISGKEKRIFSEKIITKAGFKILEKKEMENGQVFMEFGRMKERDNTGNVSATGSWFKNKIYAKGFAWWLEAVIPVVISFVATNSGPLLAGIIGAFVFIVFHFRYDKNRTGGKYFYIAKHTKIGIVLFLGILTGASVSLILLVPFWGYALLSYVILNHFLINVLVEDYSGFDFVLGVSSFYALVTIAFAGIFSMENASNNKKYDVNTQNRYESVKSSRGSKISTIERIRKRLGFYQTKEHKASSGGGIGFSDGTSRDGVVAKLKGNKARSMFVVGIYDRLGDGGTLVRNNDFDIVFNGDETSEYTDVNVLLPNMKKGETINVPIIMNGKTVSGEYLNGKVFLNMNGILTAQDDIEGTELTYKILKMTSNNEVRVSSPDSDWLIKEFAEIPSAIRLKLNNVKEARSDTVKAVMVAQILHEYFGYSQNMGVELLTGTWGNFINDVLKSEKSFVSDCDVLSTYTVIMCKYVGLDSFASTGFYNVDGGSLLSESEAHMTVYVKINGELMEFDPSILSGQVNNTGAVSDDASRASEEVGEKEIKMGGSKYEVKKFIATGYNPKVILEISERCIKAPDNEARQLFSEMEDIVNSKVFSKYNHAEWREIAKGLAAVAYARPELTSEGTIKVLFDILRTKGLDVLYNKDGTGLFRVTVNNAYAYSVLGLLELAKNRPESRKIMQKEIEKYLEEAKGGNVFSLNAINMINNFNETYYQASWAKTIIEDYRNISTNAINHEKLKDPSVVETSAGESENQRKAGRRKNIIDTDEQFSEEDINKLEMLAKEEVSRYELKPEGEDVDLENGEKGKKIQRFVISYRDNAISNFLESKNVSGACNLVGKDGTIYVFYEEYKDEYEAKEHEYLEIAWRMNLPKDKETQDAIERLGGVERSIHILAWASQILKYTDKNADTDLHWTDVRDCFFIKKQIVAMTQEQREALVEEFDNRTDHNALIEAVFGEEKAEMVKTFNRSVRDYAAGDLVEEDKVVTPTIVIPQLMGASENIGKESNLEMNSGLYEKLAGMVSNLLSDGKDNFSPKERQDIFKAIQMDISKISDKEKINQIVELRSKILYDLDAGNIVKETLLSELRNVFVVEVLASRGEDKKDVVIQLVSFKDTAKLTSPNNQFCRELSDNEYASNDLNVLMPNDVTLEDMADKAKKSLAGINGHNAILLAPSKLKTADFNLDAFKEKYENVHIQWIYEDESKNPDVLTKFALGLELIRLKNIENPNAGDASNELRCILAAITDAENSDSVNDIINSIISGETLKITKADFEAIGQTIDAIRSIETSL